MKDLPKPYSVGTYYGMPIVKNLLHPGVKDFIDQLSKGGYVGVTCEGAYYFIDGNPVIKIHPDYIKDIEQCCDDERNYQEISEYRITPERMKQILSWY